MEKYANMVTENTPKDPRHVYKTLRDHSPQLDDSDEQLEVSHRPSIPRQKKEKFSSLTEYERKSIPYIT
jgi:hypothetical protein